MPRRWHLLLLMVLALGGLCLIAAAKLRATPKYDRIGLDMTEEELEAILGTPTASGYLKSVWVRDEGVIEIGFREERDSETESHRYRVAETSIERREPLDRLAWWTEWRTSKPVVVSRPVSPLPPIPGR